MLAYLFWHRPRDPAAAEPYEQAQLAFHRSLARDPPAGMLCSVCFRARELPWLGPSREAGGGYEDWYLVEDFAALGVLNEAAVGRGHRSPHDAAARGYGEGAGGVYALLEGARASLTHSPGALGEARLAIWVSRALGAREPLLAELLGDGIDPLHASLWRRRLVLGPAPEYCLLAREAPAGVAGPRLPEGWSASTLEREAIWNG